MLMTKEQRPAIRTLQGWAISVLLETGAIRECEVHGWMQDRADPHARARAYDRPGGCTARRLSGRGRRRDSRRAGLNRRHVSGMPSGRIKIGPRPQAASRSAHARSDPRTSLDPNARS